MEALNTIKILDINVTSDSEKNILEFILMRLKKKGIKTKIFTPNPEIVTYATKHSSLKEILNSAEVSLPDGAGLLWAARMTKQRLQGRITGVDFMQKLSRECAKEGVSIGLLGGKGGVALRTAECLKERYSGLKIAYVAEEWGEEGFDKAAELMLDTRSLKLDKEAGSSKVENPSSNLKPQDLASSVKSPASNIGLLFVAFGFPKQEEWIAENIDKLPVQSMMGVGGSFDFLSGKVSRAPKWIQNLGLEWLYRLIRQPWRWKRQLALVDFMWVVLKSKFEP